MGCSGASSNLLHKTINFKVLISCFYILKCEASLRIWFVFNYIRGFERMWKFGMEKNMKLYFLSTFSLLEV